MALLSDNNPCGQTLLRLVSRGSAIIAELLRLSKNVPEVFLGPAFIRDKEQMKYSEVLFDFRYLKDPEPFEQRINANTELLDVEDEFQDNMAEILDRTGVLGNDNQSNVRVSPVIAEAAPCPSKCGVVPRLE